jgi:CHAD domain-containing protein
MTTYRELEYKYDVDEDFDIAQIPELAAASPQDSHLLEATYFDTADHRLLHARLTLRRRTGGSDAGWHLKMPLDDGSRREVRVALGRSTRTVPVALRRLIWIHTRDSELVPIAQIDTHRRVRHLVDDAGAVLAEIADDRVDARRLLPAPDLDDGRQWREVEVELVDGDKALLKRIDRTLKSSGARRSASQSKLAQALGLPQPTTTLPALTTLTNEAPTAGLRPRSPAGQVVVSYLCTEFARVRENDPEVRLDQPHSLHQMRVACRRLRSALQTFAPLFGPDTAHALADELKWLASELGRARDADVLRHQLMDEVNIEREHHHTSARLASSLDRDLLRSRREAFAAVLVALDSQRYQLLIAALDELVENPPLTARAARPANKELPRHVARADNRVHRFMRQAAKLPDGDARDERLHDARKAAKRARYAAEAVRPALGKVAERFAEQMEQLQEDLGAHHDTVLMRTRLRELAADATGTAAFTYGRLHAAEEARARTIDLRISATWKSSRKKSIRAWLP